MVRALRLGGEMGDRGVGPSTDVASALRWGAAIVATVGAVVGWTGHMLFRHLLWEPLRARQSDRTSSHSQPVQE